MSHGVLKNVTPVSTALLYASSTSSCLTLPDVEESILLQKDGSLSLCLSPSPFEYSDDDDDEAIPFMTGGHMIY